jgi:hypothetical protein
VVTAVGGKAGIPIVIASALIVSACSSKNPDTLVGMNVDENLAMMDANAVDEANGVDASVSPADTASASAPINQSNSSRDATTSKARTRTRSEDQEGATEFNAGANQPSVSEDADTNQVGNE